MQAYQIEDVIGEGRYGRVKRAVHRETNVVVAIKKVRRPPKVRGIRMPLWKLPTGLTPEVTAMQMLAPHPNILGIYDHWEKEGGNVVVMACEYAPSDVGQAVSVLHKKRKKNHRSRPVNDVKLEFESAISYIMKGLLTGLSHCHECGVIHRDIKPSNVMIAADGTIKIADFGQANVERSEGDGELTREVGTRWYVPPELLYGSVNYTEKLDMWAVGCVFAELLNGEPLFRGESDIEQMSLIFRLFGSPNEKVWPGVSQLPDFDKIEFLDCESLPFDKICPNAADSQNQNALDLLSKLLVLDPKQRLSAKDALNHPFVNNDSDGIGMTGEAFKKLMGIK